MEGRQELITQIAASAQNSESLMADAMKRCQTLSNLASPTKYPDPPTPSARGRCEQEASNGYQKLHSMEVKNMEGASKLHTSVKVANNQFRAKALLYYSRACMLADSYACAGYAALNAAPDIRY